MRTAIITFTNGQTLTTSINGTDQEITDYYKIGKYFNLGCVDDDMQAVESLIIED